MNFDTEDPKEWTQDPDRFPFVYHPNYAAFMNDQGVGRIDVVTGKIGDKKCGLPILWKRNPVLKWGQLLFPPLTENGMSLKQEEEKDLLNELIRFLSASMGISRVLQPPTFAIFQDVPGKALSIPFGTYRIALKGQEKEALFSALHGKHRNVIRNAEKHGVEIKTGEKEVPVFYALYRRTMLRNSMHLESQAYFSRFWEYLGVRNIFCGVAYQENEPQAGILVPYTQWGAFYLFGGSMDRVRMTGAMNLLHWRAMEHFWNEGVALYDMVGARLSDISGTRYEGIQRFKKRFGGDLFKGFLWKADMDRSRSRLFDALIGIRARVKGARPGQDIIDQERDKDLRD